MLDNIKFPESTFFVPQPLRPNEGLAIEFDDLITRALANPLEFPTIEQFILPGDVVALALMRNLPQPVELLDAVVAEFVASIEGAKIVAVVSPAHKGCFDSTTIRRLSEKYSAVDLEIIVHDPHDQSSVACIANNQAGEPVYVSRNLFDADVVIPVGALLDGTSLQAESYYPEFSSNEVLERFRNPPEGTSQKQLEGEVRMAEQNLGTEFSILVVRGPGESVTAIRAGSSQSLLRALGEETDSLWSIDCQSEGELVVATIEGSGEQQTWHDVFRAIAAAVAASQTVRQIVVCSQISEEPNSEQMDVLQLQFEVDLDRRCQKLEALSGVEQIIPGVLESTSVYLFSQLTQDVVEEAGLGYVESESQIQKIVDRADSGILLRDAHLCRVAVSG